MLPKKKKNTATVYIEMPAADHDGSGPMASFAAAVGTADLGTMLPYR